MGNYDQRNQEIEKLQTEDVFCETQGQEKEQENKRAPHSDRETKLDKAKEKMTSGWYAKRAKGCYYGSIVPLAMGFFKMYVYKNGEYSWETVINAYVGGDAYNFIINAHYVIAWFLLALILIMMGSCFLICYEMAESREAKAQNTVHTVGKAV